MTEKGIRTRGTIERKAMVAAGGSTLQGAAEGSVRLVEKLHCLLISQEGGQLDAVLPLVKKALVLMKALPPGRVLSTR